MTATLLDAPYPLSPEKVLQFGTGILLRGLPDYFIDRANRQGMFNGSVVVVKSTPGDAADFARQHNRYTTLVRGLHNGLPVSETFVNGSLSRVLVAASQWADVLHTASNPDIRLVVSNTTEVGLKFVPESIFQSPPTSFPAKLTAWLYERYCKLGSDSPHTAVVPTELIPDNGPLLRMLVEKISAHNGLEAAFARWLAVHVSFCSSLVDRIVTRASTEAAAALPFPDPLAIQTEPYRLWAVEGGEAVRQIFGFAEADTGVVIAEDITYYRERKLRLLNGTHTISVCLAYLTGFDTVYEMMQDAETSGFVQSVMLHEIVPSVLAGNPADLHAFANEVLNRFQNPHIVHPLLSITLQATSKMKTRNIPVFLRYHAKFGSIPPLMTLGFAAYILFMRAVRQDNEKFYGQRKGVEYLIKDTHAAFFYSAWRRHGRDFIALATDICTQTSLWDTDLSQMPGFITALARAMDVLAAGQSPKPALPTTPPKPTLPGGLPRF